MIVFTNGCFDVLHVGHVRLLEFAREQGDMLVVGVNSDASVRRLKGRGRPVVCASERVEMLRALRCVSEVYVFEDDTPLNLIGQLRPDVLVKGPDYKMGEVVGGALVKSWGGRVVVPQWDVTVSTTSLLARI